MYIIQYHFVPAHYHSVTYARSYGDATPGFGEAEECTVPDFPDRTCTSPILYRSSIFFVFQKSVTFLTWKQIKTGLECLTAETQSTLHNTHHYIAHNIMDFRKDNLHFNLWNFFFTFIKLNTREGCRVGVTDFNKILFGDTKSKNMGPISEGSCHCGIGDKKNL